MGVIAYEKKATGEFFVTGEAALDGGNPTPIVTPFRVVTSVTLTLKLAVTPGVLVSVLTYTQVDGLVNVYAWKVTNSTTTTMVADTGNVVFSYFITGTK